MTGSITRQITQVCGCMVKVSARGEVLWAVWGEEGCFQLGKTLLQLATACVVLLKSLPFVMWVQQAQTRKCYTNTSSSFQEQKATLLGSNTSGCHIA